MEKGNTSLLSASRLSFHFSIQINMELTTDFETTIASSFLQTVVGIETSMLSKEAKLLMLNRTSSGTRKEPWVRPCVKRGLELKALKTLKRVLQSLKKDQMHRMNVDGIPVSNKWSSNFSLQTVSHALLKANSISKERYINSCWKPSSIACTIWVIWASQLRPLKKMTCNRLNRFLVLVML